MHVETLSRAEARRIALRAQGLQAPRPGRPVTSRALLATVRRLGLLQIDAVNVLARAHLVPVFSRLGPYDPALLEAASGSPPRRLVEAWAHEASFIPVETFPLLGWRRQAYATAAWGLIAAVPNRYPAEVALVLAMLADRGPLTSAQIHAELAERHPRAAVPQWGWNWTVAKRVLEFLFFVGEVSAASRTAGFARRYDLTARVLPASVLAARVPDDDARRALVEVAARAHGVASVRCLADYFRMSPVDAAAVARDLAAAGVLVPVRVDGWGPAYRHAEAVLPRRATGRALLSPFDPLVFERRRAQELFGLRYRIEIYTPAARRVWGYYVLPFLLGDALAALVDLRADRAARVLAVPAVHTAPAEQHAGPQPSSSALVAALADELVLVADWLRLERVVVGDRGDLAAPLARELAARER